jgi:mRNA interferase RelE/StbE
MRLQYTERFRRSFAGLDNVDSAWVQKALRQLAHDPHYPSLRVKRVLATEGIWEARASDSLRITFEVHGDLLILRAVGAHDATLRNP